MSHTAPDSLPVRPGRTSRLLLAALAGLSLAGCGAGTAAVASGTGGGSSPGSTDVNEPPTLEISMSERELSPARVSVRVIDLDQASPIDVALSYRVDGGPSQPMTLLPSPASDTTEDLVGDDAGTEYVYAWDFQADLGSTALQTDLVIRVEAGSIADERPDYVGNDQPQPVITKQTGQTGQITVVFNPLEQALADLADVVEGVEVNQEVFVKPEVLVDGQWRPAQPVPEAGTAGFELTLGPDGFVAVVSAETGEPTESPFPLWTTNAPLSSFPWDTTDLLADRSGFFEFRLTVKDEFTLPGDLLPAVTAMIFVDNAELATTIDEEALVTGGDRRGAITIPFQFTNVANGSVRFVLQAAQDGVFAPLPDPGVGSVGNGGSLDDQLDQILHDPAARAELGILDQEPFEAAVDLTLLGEPTAIRCADLRGEANWFAGVPRVGGASALPLAGSRVRVLRGGAGLAPADEDWDAGALAGLGEFELLGDGERAVVLSDGPAWGLAVVETATGTGVALEGVTFQGIPRGIDVDPTGRFVFVVGDAAGGLGDWVVYRVPLPGPGDAQWTAAATSWSTGVSGEFRAFEALGSTTVAIATPDRLITSHLDLATGLVSSGALLQGLQGVNDLELDRRDPRTLLMAVGRSGDQPGYLAAVDLDTGRAVRRPDPELVDPRSVSQPTDARSLFVLEAGAGASPRLLDVGYRHGRIQGDPVVLDDGLPADVRRVRAAGGRSRVVLTESSSPRLWAAGGVLVDRALEGFDPTSGELRLVDPLPASLVGLPEGTPRRARLVSPRPESPVWLPPGRSSLRWASDLRWPKGGVTLRIVPFTDQVKGDSAEVSFDLTSDFDDQPDMNVFDTNTFVGNPVAMEPAELNGDGRPDLVYLRSADDAIKARLFVIRQFFQSQSPLKVGTSVGDGTLVSIDVDRDGSDELLYGARGDDGGEDGVLGDLGDLRLIDWVPPKNLATFDSIDLPGTVGTRHLAVADLNQDGLDDVLALDAAHGRVEVFFGQSPTVDEAAFGAAPSTTVFTANTVEDDAAALVVADLDGDGDQDLVIAAGTQLEFFAGYVVAPGAWAVAPPVALGLGSVGDLVSGRAIDADADGRVDLALSFAGGGEHLRLYRFDGLLGGLVEAGSVGHGPEPTTVGHLAVVDVDGDGESDVATGNFGPVTGVDVYRSPAGQPLEPDLQAGKGPIALPVNPQPAAFAFADWIGNGRPDLFTGAYFPGSQTTFSLTVQAAPGDFREGYVLDLGQQLRFDRLTFGDVDGDLLLDAVGVPPDDESALHVYRQDAPGQFSAVPSQVLVAPFQATLGGLAVREPRRVEVADFDGDGYQDVLALTEVGYDGYIAPGAHDCTEPYVVDFLSSEVRESTFVLWRGRPDGTLEPVGTPFGFDVEFGSEVAYGCFATDGEPHGNAIRDVAFGDVNGDGRIDLRVAHSRTHPVADCNGSQLWYIAFQHLSIPRDVGELYEGAVHTYINNGTSTPFSDPPEVTVPFTPMSTFRFADGDGDGLLDVLRFPISVVPAGEWVEGPTLYGYFVTWEAVELLPAVGEPVEVTFEVDSGNTLFEFDANILIEDWTLDGAPDLLIAGEGIEISGEDSRLWFLDGHDWLAGQPVWQEISFYSPVSTEQPPQAVEMKYVVPVSVADVDEDGLPDLAARFVGGNFGLAFSTGGFKHDVESGLLMRLSPAVGDVEPVWLSSNEEWLALPALKSLRSPRFVDVDQDGNFELFGTTPQPDPAGSPTLFQRPVFLFSDR